MIKISRLIMIKALYKRKSIKIPVKTGKGCGLTTLQAVCTSKIFTPIWDKFSFKYSDRLLLDISSTIFKIEILYFKYIIEFEHAFAEV